MAKINIKGDIVSRDMAPIYDYFGITNVSPDKVEAALEDAGGEEVELDIASYGGYVTGAIEIYQALRNYKGEVKANISFACSAATIIACAADESSISEVGFFMIHNAQSWAAGDKEDLNKEADVLNTIDQGIINAYERKTGMSREDIQSLMSADTYMSAQEAIEKGFVDGLIDVSDNVSDVTTEDIVRSAAASSHALIPEDKAMEMMKALKIMKKMPDITDLVQTPSGDEPEDGANSGDTGQISGNNAGSDKTTQEGGNTMGLNEILAEHPEISNEIDERIAEARAEGVKEGVAQERARMQSLDDISASVTPEMLNEAKYGENPMDGQALAFKAMKENQAQGASYLAQAQADAADSGADDVGLTDPDAGEEDTDEAEASAIANYVNKQRGGE